MAKRGVQVQCEGCGHLFTVQMPGQLPPCEACGQIAWKLVEPPLILTVNDRKFLKAIHISADD